jgi:hypothetical protein
MTKDTKETQKDYLLFCEYLRSEYRDLLSFCLSKGYHPAKIGIIFKKNNWEKRAQEHDFQMAQLFEQKQKEVIESLATISAKEQREIQLLSTKLVHENLLRLSTKMATDRSLTLKVPDIEKINSMIKPQETSENEQELTDEQIEAIDLILNSTDND